MLHYTDPNLPSEVTGYNIHRAWTANIQYVDPIGALGSPWYYKVAPFNGACGAKGPW